MPNRLQDATSTYLLQHADNPVDWWQWSDAALAEARRRGVPVLLSVGYASCHWCHVMARESFTDPETAALINENFVPVKVDREERPDVDAVYMTATQALTGSGGWPMTVFLTPDGEPFYAGTYFPPHPASGLPSFTQLLTALSEAWRDNRGEVLGAAGRIRDALRDMAAPLTSTALTTGDLDRAAAAVIAQADLANGGFGGAPKFPPALVLEFLLRHHERTGSVEALELVTLTLAKMADGGLFDQLGGGFARYSVDTFWHIPHFEKMAEDNALLLGVYAHHARLTGSAPSEAIARATAGFVLSTLLTDQGLFAASLDAEAGGAEGSTYYWTIDEVRGVLGDDAEEAARVFGLHDGPDGQVLRRVAEPGDPATFEGIRQRLLSVRAARPQPSRDDIVVVRSNGLMITALAAAGSTLGEPDWIAVADRAVVRLAEVHSVDGELRHSSRHGRVGPGPATLADHADLAMALLAVHQATGDPARLTEALTVLQNARSAFGSTDGGFFDAADQGLIIRPRDPTDGAAPSGASSIADALLTASALTGSAELRSAADAALGSAAAVTERFPRSAGRHLSVAEAAARGPLQIAVSGPGGSDRAALAAVARRRAPGGSVIVVGVPDATGQPLLADRPAIRGRPAAYVCRGLRLRSSGHRAGPPGVTADLVLSGRVAWLLLVDAGRCGRLFDEATPVDTGEHQHPGHRAGLRAEHADQQVPGPDLGGAVGGPGRALDRRLRRSGEPEMAGPVDRRLRQPSGLQDHSRRSKTLFGLPFQGGGDRGMVESGGGEHAVSLGAGAGGDGQQQVLGLDRG